MEFEREILYGFRVEYEEYLKENRNIYESTRKYFRYLESKEYLTKKLADSYEQLNLEKEIYDRYKLKLIAENSLVRIYRLEEEILFLQEDISHIDSILKDKVVNLEIYRQYITYESDIHRLKNQIEKLDKFISEVY